MKNQTLFSSKDKSEKSKCRLLQFLFGTLRVIANVEILGAILACIFKKLRRANIISRHHNVHI